MLRVERYNTAKHYDVVAALWKAHGAEVLPAEILPPTGAVAVLDEKPIAACHVWLTNASMAYMAMPCAAPGLAPRTAWLAVDGTVRLCIAIAREAGCKCVWGAAENRGVDRIFTRAGMTLATPLNNYFLMLEPGISPDMLTD